MMQTIQTVETVETQLPVLRESFHTTPFRQTARRKSSLSNLIRRQLQLQQQQQLTSKPQGHQQTSQKERQPTEHARLHRSASSPSCEATERADGQERERERGGERGRERAHARLLSAAASEAEAEAAAAAATSQQLHSAPERESASVREGRGLERASGSTAQIPLPPPQPQHPQPPLKPELHPLSQHGLIAKGVWLLKNMGNQEAKQRKAGAAGAASGAEGTGNVVRAEDGKGGFHSKKSQSKSSKLGDSAKKKAKAESTKTSVFSNLKKGLSRAKGASRESILDGGDFQASHPDGSEIKASDASLSGDELGGMTDSDPERGQPTAEGEEEGRSTGSESDTDIYSFHSATDHQDLLADIQLAMCKQHGDSIPADLLTANLPRDPTIPDALCDLPLDPETGSGEALAEVDGARVEVRRNDTKMELNASETIAAPVSEELDHLAESGPVSVSEVPQLTITKTPSTQSFPDTASPNTTTNTTTNTSYESADEPPDEEAGGATLGSPFESVDCHHDLTKVIPVGLESVLELPDPRAKATGVAVTTRSHKSVSSIDLNVVRDEDEEGGISYEELGFLSPQRRTSSSISFTQWASENPQGSRARRASAAGSIVKPYPTIHPSYVKTTTRQLTSPTHSPVGSPAQSPQVPRREGSSLGLGSSRAERWRAQRQRSSSIAGPISYPSDWAGRFAGLRAGSEDGPELSQEKVPEQSLGTRRTSSCLQTYGGGFSLDVFSGELAALS